MNPSFELKHVVSKFWMKGMQIVGKLGEGSFADVYKVRSPEGTCYAIKRLKKHYRSLNEVHKLEEINALRVLQDHPNIVKLHDLIYDAVNGYVAMVFELLDMNLYEFSKGFTKPMDETKALLLIYQLLSALQYMHSKNLFHRDVKPENCMINKDTFELKLVDFGSTRCYQSRAPYTEYVSTRWYRAPECILTAGSYGPEVDEWAVGCMLYELLTNKPLFPGKNEIDQINRIHNIVGSPDRDILSTFRQNPNTQIKFAFPKRESKDMRNYLPRASSDAIDLLEKLLKYNPSDRISAEDALQHPAFDRIREQEQKWKEQGCPNSFAGFFLNKKPSAYQPPVIRPPVTKSNDVKLPKSNIANPTYKPVVASKPSVLKANVDPALYQSRLRAYQRIQKYQTKNQNKPANAINGYHFVKPSLPVLVPKPPKLYS